MTKSYEETWGKLDWEKIPDEELAQLVKDMVTLGADVNAEDINGLTALMTAAVWNKTETVKALVEAGADVNAKDEDGWTALMFAADYGRTETVKALAELGADINAKNNEGKSALDYINDQKTTREIIKLAADYQRKQQEKDSSPKAQNDKNKMAQNDTVANNLKNAVESRVQGGDTYEVADDIKKADGVNITIQSVNAKYRTGGR